MDFFDRLAGLFRRRSQPGETSAGPEIDSLSDYLHQAVPLFASNPFAKINPEDTEAGAALLSGPPEIQLTCLLTAMRNLVSANAGFLSGGSSDGYARAAVLKALVIRLLRRNLPFGRDQLNELLESAVRSRGIAGELPWDSILSQVERFTGNEGLTLDLHNNLEAARRKLARFGTYSRNKKLLERIDLLLGAAKSKRGVALKRADAWTSALMDRLDTLPPNSRAAWYDLLNVAAGATSSKPADKLLRALSAKVGAVGADRFSDVMCAVLDAVGTRGPKEISLQAWLPGDRTLVHADFGSTLRGLIWACAGCADDAVVAAIGNAAARCYEKVPNIGPRAPKIGNACVYALSVMESPLAVSQLTRLRTKVKHRSVRKQVERGVDRAAREAGLSGQELEELAVPSFGLTAVGELQMPVGEFTARLTVVDANSTDLGWLRPDGKMQKSVPSAVRDRHGAELKKIRNCAKEIIGILPGQRNRIERLLLLQPSWRLPAWLERYMDHPLLGTLCRRLIWKFVDEGGSIRLGIWDHGKIVDEIGRELEGLNETTTVQPWHPIESSREVVLAWRIWIEEQKVRQPFKQAHREVYYVTPAERLTGTYSNRFAGHVIKQHQFSALCKERGWAYTLQGSWDSHNIPTITLPEFDSRVEFWVDSLGVDQTSEMGIFLYVTTDQVRFYAIGEQEPMSVERVPPILFSELMRDVDLFVGVCSVGNDPNWQDTGPEGHQAYWNVFSFGDLSETAKTRKEFLERLIPKLKIASRCHVEGNFLVVRGDIRTYKIHLGSSNILMLPNDAYLCIVPGPEHQPPHSDRLMLPFDGDRTLSVILSKAFLLADDSKISDPLIVSQLRSR